MVVPVTCSDGRKGEVAITRDKSKVSGTATGRLSDGTEARFAFGDRKFDQLYVSNKETVKETIVKEVIIPVPVPVQPSPPYSRPAPPPRKEERVRDWDI